MDFVGSLDSSRDLQPICAKSFINRLHLVLQISKIPSQNLFAKHLNMAAGGVGWHEQLDVQHRESAGASMLHFFFVTLLVCYT